MEKTKAFVITVVLMLSNVAAASPKGYRVSDFRFTNEHAKSCGKDNREGFFANVLRNKEYTFYLDNEKDVITMFSVDGETKIATESYVKGSGPAYGFWRLSSEWVIIGKVNPSNLEVHIILLRRTNDHQCYDRWISKARRV